MFKEIQNFLNKTRLQSVAPEPPAKFDPITGVLMDDLVSAPSSASARI